MSTNATFSWTPQSGIVAQEVWYGRLTDVGSTLPPGSGWNQGANLYSATASVATLNNLDENTKYQFLVKSHCSSGDSQWSILSQYKLICPVVSTTPHTNSIDVSLAISNPTEFAKIVNTLNVSLVEVSSGNTASSANYSGVTIVNPLTATFQGLTASNAYNVIVTYQLVSGGTATLCSSATVSTSAIVTCPVMPFTLSNPVPNGFTVNPSGLSVGDTYDISTDGGTTFAIINGSQPSQIITGLASNQTYSVVLRRNCSNGTSSVTPMQQVTTTANNFNVIDVWYTCSNSVCSGQAVWASNATIRRVSDNTVIYAYNNDPSIPNGFSTFVPGIQPGVAYSLTATWVINSAKTNGISAVFLTGNTTSQNWATALPTITETITFTGAVTNNISVSVSSRGPKCTC